MINDIYLILITSIEVKAFEAELLYMPEYKMNFFANFETPIIKGLSYIPVIKCKPITLW